MLDTHDEVGHERGEARDLLAEAGDLGLDVDPAAARGEHPARGAVEQTARLQEQRALRGRRHLVVEGLDPGPERGQSEDLAGHGVGAGDLDRSRTCLLAGTEGERDAPTVDHVVHDDRGDDLAAQRVGVQDRVVRRGELAREVAAQHPGEPRLVGELGLEQVVGERDLRVRQQYGELGRRESLAVRVPQVDLGVGRQELQSAVEVAARLERADEPLVHREHRVRLHAGVAEQDVLLVVVAQDEVADLVGHVGEEHVALLGREVAVAHHLVEQDLDVDLVVGGVDAGGVVDRVGVDAHAAVERPRCGRAG